MVSALFSSPFVLLDDARPDGQGRTRLYRDLLGEVRADHMNGVQPALARLKQAYADGLHVAGFIGYEAGKALEPRLTRLGARRAKGDPPLLWFGLFRDVEELEQGYVAELLEGAGPEPELAPTEPLLERTDYEAAFAAVRDAIVAGDVYQANLTFAARVRVGESPAAFYRAVRPRAAAGHGAMLFTGADWLLSFSPESFFSLDGDMLTTRPMKGTAPRGSDATSDAEYARGLRQDAKQQAENLMIVDLLRNDLSRIAMPGSVAVPELFTIETYPSVHQMTSTVTARLRSGLDPIDVLAAMFPCGSITGAPKIRAMEIIHQVEERARGPYTGAIGAIEPSGRAAFNVAIRTVCVNNGNSWGTIGLGSGVVADSRAESEWRECLDKARFLSMKDFGRDQR